MGVNLGLGSSLRLWETSRKQLICELSEASTLGSLGECLGPQEVSGGHIPAFTMSGAELPGVVKCQSSQAKMKVTAKLLMLCFLQ